MRIAALQVLELNSKNSIENFAQQVTIFRVVHARTDAEVNVARLVVGVLQEVYVLRDFRRSRNSLNLKFEWKLTLSLINGSKSLNLLMQLPSVRLK